MNYPPNTGNHPQVTGILGWLKIDWRWGETYSSEEQTKLSDGRVVLIIRFAKERDKSLDKTRRELPEEMYFFPEKLS